jgi:hypothetical protein
MRKHDVGELGQLVHGWNTQLAYPVIPPKRRDNKEMAGSGKGR